MRGPDAGEKPSRASADAGTRGHGDAAMAAEGPSTAAESSAASGAHPRVAVSGGVAADGVPVSADARNSACIAQSEVRVRYVETDQMGFAHHSHYFAWFEIGRTDFIRALGTSYAELERGGLLLAIAEASVRYLQAARYDDRLLVTTRLERVQSRSVTFAYEVERLEPEPRVRVATSTMKLIALDANGSPRTLPPDFRRRLEQVVPPADA